MNNVLKMKNKMNFYLERTQRNQFFIGGEEGQLKIQSLKIGVAGLGGMGSNIAEYLVRLGIGEISIADNDTIDTSNINRQVIANTETVGKKKSDASLDELNKIAPEIQINQFKEGITKDNADDFVLGCDFIVDEIDVFPIEAHYHLHKAARKHNIPIYSAYVVGLGVHFYKFQGDDFKFEDFIKWNSKMNEIDVLEEVAKKVAFPIPAYLSGQNLDDFKQMAVDKGVPIFGPSCLVGHSIVVTRILCDFLDGEVRGTKISSTPVMPEFLRIDFSTLEIEKVTFKNQD